MSYRDVSKVVVKRLPIYLRALDNQLRNSVQIVSSRDLSQITGFSAEQIRKDLAYFGAFGTRGTGYSVDYLRNKIMQIIGLHENNRVVIVGMGHLGIAFARHTITKNPYVKIVGAFDIDPEVVGTDLFDQNINHISEMKEVIEAHKVNVAIITVPVQKAQAISDQLIQYGITAILNFTPTTILVEEDLKVCVHNVDLSMELQCLMYYGLDERQKVSI